MDTVRRPRVLVIDDETRVREFLCDLLTVLDCEADGAANGVEGLAVFESGRYDLVLTDVSMPGVTGWDVAKAVRRRAPTVGVVLLTGATADLHTARARQWGLTLLEKPVQLRALATVLRQALVPEVSPEQTRTLPLGKP